MGACIDMRDEPMDAPIPERFEPSDYSSKKIAEIEMELARLKAMSTEEASQAAKADYAAEIQRNSEAIQKAVDLRNKYQAMLAQVVGWEPPTSDHAGLKKFMLEQLQESMRFDCAEDYYRDHAPTLLSGERWKAAHIDKCKRDIAYHKNAHADEITRVDARNLWIAQLRKGLSTGANHD